MTTVNFRHVTDESGALPMNDNDRAARDEQYRAGIWEKANEAMLRIKDDELRRHVAEQLHRQGQNRVKGGVDADGNPDSVMIWVEVLVAGEWVEITHFPPADVGMTDEDVAETIRLLRYQSGVDIPDDISGLTDPPP
jgi:hypothetical protein